MSFEHPGVYAVAIQFAARPVPVADGEWRQCEFAVPSSNVRELEVEADRTDLEIQFPEALRVNRETIDGRLILTALLGPSRPFIVKWKPKVAELDAKLVLTCEANTVASAGTGAMRMDAVFAFEIAQGRLTELAFNVPATLSVTQVRGAHIRDWRLEETTDDGVLTGRRLIVILNRPVTDMYGLQIFAELPLPAFPAEVDLPVITPEDVRATGHVSIGTDSAIQLVVKRSAGLSQIDASAFPMILLSRDNPRPLPKSKAFFYSYAALPYEMELSLDDIVPSYDAASRFLVEVKEDDLAVNADIELDVRDAPVRSVVFDVPSQFSVAEVSGAQVARDSYSARDAGGGKQAVEVLFSKPVLGRTLVKLRLELGKTPLDAVQSLEGFAVAGAKNERGYLVVAVEEGVQIDTPDVEELRQVHTGSVPIQTAEAQYAYRFRSSGWKLSLHARRMHTSIRSEAFHLVSLGEGVAYTSVTFTYFISGAPVEEFNFRIPDELDNVEFVGQDVSRWQKEDDRWTVRLHRKVIGDYNIGRRQRGVGRRCRIARCGSRNRLRRSCQPPQRQTDDGRRAGRKRYRNQAGGSARALQVDGERPDYAGL